MPVKILTMKIYNTHIYSHWVTTLSIIDSQTSIGERLCSTQQNLVFTGIKLEGVLRKFFSTRAEGDCLFPYPPFYFASQN